MTGTDTAVLQCVLDSDSELQYLLREEARIHQLLEEGDGSGAPAPAAGGDGSVSAASSATAKSVPGEDLSKKLTEITNRLSMMDATTAESRASEILSGLQFSTEMMAMPTKALSGGWRMRWVHLVVLFADAPSCPLIVLCVGVGVAAVRCSVALACALFVQPDLLLLDEPTNHLDFPAVVWLEDYIEENLNGILVVVSHDRAFLDSICTDIVHLSKCVPPLAATRACSPLHSGSARS